MKKFIPFILPFILIFSGITQDINAQLQLNTEATNFAVWEEARDANPRTGTEAVDFKMYDLQGVDYNLGLGYLWQVHFTPESETTVGYVRPLVLIQRLAESHYEFGRTADFNLRAGIGFGFNYNPNQYLSLGIEGGVYYYTFLDQPKPDLKLNVQFNFGVLHPYASIGKPIFNRNYDARPIVSEQSLYVSFGIFTDLTYW